MEAKPRFLQAGVIALPTKSASSFAPFRFAFDAVMAYLLTPARTFTRRADALFEVCCVPVE
jgi:hypothetical protein